MSLNLSTVLKASSELLSFFGCQRNNVIYRHFKNGIFMTKLIEK